MELTLTRVEKARVAFDAQRRWLADMEKVKEKKPAKYTQAVEALQQAQKVSEPPRTAAHLHIWPLQA